MVFVLFWFEKVYRFLINDSGLKVWQWVLDFTATGIDPRNLRSENFMFWSEMGSRFGESSLISPPPPPSPNWKSEEYLPPSLPGVQCTTNQKYPTVNPLCGVFSRQISFKLNDWYTKPSVNFPEALFASIFRTPDRPSQIPWQLGTW